MRYLVLSDIHSNLEAFTAVLQRVRRKRFDRTVILGDLVGYGADPNPIVDRVRKLKRSVIIRGNHDKVCSGIDNGEMFNKVALQSARWTENQLLPRHRKWLRALPKGPVTVGGRSVDLPWNTARRRCIHFWRDRGSQHVSVFRDAYLLLRSQPFSGRLRSRRRSPHDPHSADQWQRQTAG